MLYEYEILLYCDPNKIQCKKKKKKTAVNKKGDQIKAD